MQVGIPIAESGGLEARVEEHFGRAPFFAVVDTESGTVELVENQGHHQGGQTPPPVILARAGAEVVVAGDIGRGAVTRLDDRDIPVYRGADGTVEAAIEQWEADELERVGPADVHGHDHDHDHAGHGHGHSHGDDHDHDHAGNGHGHSHGSDHGHAGHSHGDDHHLEGGQNVE